MGPIYFPKINSTKTKIFSRKKSSGWNLKDRAVMLLLLNMMIPCQAGATASYGEASDLFTVGAGARSLAMGGAFTGLADDASAPYFNPAGLAFLDEHQLMVMHAPLFIDSNYNFLSSAHPFGDKLGSLAFSDALLLSNNFQVRDKFNNLNSNGSLNHNAFFASYAHKITQKISAGVNLKFIQQKVADFSGNALGWDAGFMFKPARVLSVGASFANINSPELKLRTSEDIYRPIARFGIASDVFKNKLTLAADASKIKNQGTLIAAGVEYRPNQLFSLRTGYNANRSYTLGVGLALKTFFVDYAFSDTDLGAFNKVSFTWKWHNIYKTEIDPPYKEGCAVYPLAGFENKINFHANVPTHVVANWSLVIKDADNKEVRTLKGDLRPPEDIMWDAKNTVGEPVIAGDYSYTFMVNYKNGKSWQRNGSINLDLPKRKTDEEVDMTIQLNGTKESELILTEPENQQTNLEQPVQGQ
jgi:hypothetical protein